jgi:hypothetical protein
MFMQVIEGKVGNAEALRGQLETWHRDLAPGAEGWLGSTSGFTADNTFVGVVRFESEEAANANNQRPEQGAWWEATQAAIDGEATFTNCPEADTWGGGGSDEAGFVQVIMGRGDRAAIVPVIGEIESTLREMRPDVIGGTVGWPGDGTFIQTVYFTSEGEARAAESAEPATDEDRAAQDKLMSSMQFDRYIDLPEPMLWSR